jgi:hypothetical protein
MVGYRVGYCIVDWMCVARALGMRDDCTLDKWEYLVCYIGSSELWTQSILQ